ncbi:MAG: PIG-L family deacetylase [Solobacterium sp.]|nr:PIG-L family deacetylase [Solobacterium sp.]
MRMLVVAAHVGDFVWRSAGSIAKYVQEGHHVEVIVLSDGLIAEAAEYWKRPGANEEEGSLLRQEEGRKAAEILLGSTENYHFLGWKDHPIVFDQERMDTLVKLIRDAQPDFIVTHDLKRDLYNPDHGNTAEFVLEASCFARSTGRIDGHPRLTHVAPLFGMEAENPDICDFKPGCYVDITEVIDKKCEAMKAIQTQSKMYDKYLAKAVVRGREAVNRCGRKGCQYAEVFSINHPIGSEGRFVF